MISHKTYFDTVLRDMESAGREITVLIVSGDGLVLDSNTADEHAEEHLAAMASLYLDFGQKMMSIPGFTAPAAGPAESMILSLSVSQSRFIALTRLSENMVMIVSAENKGLIAEVMKRSLAQVDRLNALVRNNEIQL